MIELEKAMIIRRPPRADQVDLHAICSECVRATRIRLPTLVPDEKDPHDAQDQQD